MPESKIYNMDCLAAMREMPDKAFSLAVVDPPYGIGAASMNMGIGKSKKASKAKNRKWNKRNWDDNAPPDEYFKQLFRVSKNQMIWGGNYFNVPACKFYVIWDKQVPDGLTFADCEMCWTSFDFAPRIFRYSAYLDKQSKFHPTQKPIALYKWLLQNYAKPGGYHTRHTPGQWLLPDSRLRYGLRFYRLRTRRRVLQCLGGAV